MGTAGDHYVGTMIHAVGDAGRYLVVGVAPDPLRRFYAGDLDLRILLLESSVDGWYTALVDDDLLMRERIAKPTPYRIPAFAGIR